MTQADQSIVGNPPGEPPRAAPGTTFSVIGLAILFFLASHASFVLRVIRPIAIQLAMWFGGDVVSNITDNAHHIFGRPLSRGEARAFARRVIGNFYDFVIEMGRCADRSTDELFQRIARTEGAQEYFAMRKANPRGAILVTAHMGSFEVGLAALCDREKNVHVVFKRDSFGGFERIRARVRATLGVREAPIDDGLPALVRLRDALQDQNAVVVMQGDRAMPGQRAATVPFLSGHMRLPLGPVKLAQLTGSPIVPVFTVHNGSVDGDRFIIHLCDAIEVENGDTDAALLKIARAMESFVAKYPDQWLVLERAFAAETMRAE